MSEQENSRPAETSSSILEFLKNEKNCGEAINFDEYDFEKTFTSHSFLSDADESFVFGEINRLSEHSDKTLGDILQEAENLIKQRPKLFDHDERNEEPIIKKPPVIPKPIAVAPVQKHIPTPTPVVSIEKHTLIPTPSALTQTVFKPTANVQHSPKRLQRPPFQHQQLGFVEPKSISPQPTLHNVKYNETPTNNKHQPTYSHSSAFVLPTTPTSNKNKTAISSVTEQFAAREKRFCDKSTTPSPTHSVSHSNSWSKERELEKNIEELQEKLKDTAERFQSLKIQHDSLSSVHRVLREEHGPLQEETEKLKLDVQHLNECANVLRNELHAARSDRDAALEIQKILRTDLDESRQDRKKYQCQTEKDVKQIQDLQRQCKEMERILMRKHPDSVSALIVASKSSGSPFSSSAKEDSASINTRKVLEQRIAQLENDALEQDRKSQSILSNVQSRFNSVQSKYETHIGDLETQVLSLQDINAKLGEKVIRKSDEVNRLKAEVPLAADLASMFTQTEDVAERDFAEPRSIGVQTDALKPGSASSTGSSGSRLTSKKPTAQSSTRLTNSQSESVLQHGHSGRDDSHLLATIRGMRYDLAIKEKAVQRVTRELDECKKTIKKLQKEAPQKPSATSSAVVTPSRKIYDSAQYQEHQETQALKEAHSRIKFLEKDYKILHEKRLSDLKTLQAAHEKELQACQDTVNILQLQLSEKETQISHEKRRNHHQVDYYALKAKVSSLERRHSEREKRLHLLVEALSQGKLNGINNNNHHLY